MTDQERQAALDWFRAFLKSPTIDPLNREVTYVPCGDLVEEGIKSTIIEMLSPFPHSVAESLSVVQNDLVTTFEKSVNVVTKRQAMQVLVEFIQSIGGK